MLMLKDIKEKLNSVVFMAIGSALAVLAVLLMFAPGIKANGVIESSAGVFWNQPDNYFAVGAWPVFVGYMLILLAAIVMGVIALPVVNISAKLEKGLLIASVIALLAGAVIIMCIVPIIVGLNSGNPKWYECMPAPFIAGTLAILSAGCGVVSLKFDW